MDQSGSIEDSNLKPLASKEAKSESSIGKAKGNGQGDKESVHLAGEYYVAAELHRRKIHATITYGNAKSADILAFSLDGERFARVEVKSSRPAKGSVLAWTGTLDRFVSRLNQFWVLCIVPDMGDETSKPRFYIYSCSEMYDEIAKKRDAYVARRGKEGDPTKWMWSFSSSELTASSALGAWHKIVDYLRSPSIDPGT